VIRQRGGTTRRRDDQDDDSISSAAEIGRLLREAREERGLDLLSVHDRLSRPITQLEALERGDLAGLPDQALALSTLRRYAAFLGLDGDALALQMIDAWSTSPPATQHRDSDRSNNGAQLTNVVAAVTTGPDHLRAFTQTGQVPKVGAGSTAAAGGYGYDVGTGPPTGTFPVVPRQELRQSKRAVARARRRLRAPRSLKIITWLTALLLIAVVVGTVMLEQRPAWLASAHVLRVVEPAGAQSASRGVTTTGPGQAAPVTPTGSGGGTSSYSVNTKAFVVDVTTTGRCWVEVVSSQSSVPLVEGVQPAGQRLSYPAQGTMTVQVGSSAVVVGISVKGKVVFYNAPRAAPYTYVFTPVAST
jgi:transcriptional regulator with XRE-family HTH domain